MIHLRNVDSFAKSAYHNRKELRKLAECILAGRRGEQGIQGPTGSTGPQGPVGPAGTPGVTARMVKLKPLEKYTTQSNEIAFWFDQVFDNRTVKATVSPGTQTYAGSGSSAYIVILTFTS